MHLCCILFACYLLFLPPFLPVDPATATDDTVEYDDYVDDQTTTAELPGKQSPSPLPDITYLFRIILALGIAAATAIIPIPLHYLSLSPLYYCTLPCPMLLRIITHQLALRPCQSAMLSYRAAITVGSERGTLHYCNFIGRKKR